MKEIILSADGDSVVYSVPDAVADDLQTYCTYFSGEWMWNSPYAAKFKINGAACFNEADFIDYLNEHVFPEQKSFFVKNLGWIDFGETLPAEYRNLPYFNF